MSQMMMVMCNKQHLIMEEESEIDFKTKFLLRISKGEPNHSVMAGCKGEQKLQLKEMRD